jgi:hypothetical protein
MEIEYQLERIKKALLNYFDFVKRKKNVEFLANYGLNIQTIKQCILDLKPQDYKEGPVQDKDRPGELWVFVIELEGIENIYIKLKLFNYNSKECLKCISFHN